MIFATLLRALSVTLLLAAFSAAAGQTGAPPIDIDHQRLTSVDKEPHNWLSHGLNYAETRQSPLTQITPANVSKLGLAWYFDTNTTRGLEATPLVVDGVMYFTTSWSQVFALDARTGAPLWHFDPEVPRSHGANACCDVVNRGVAAWGKAVFVGTLDGRLIALDRRDGRVIWETLTVDPQRPYTITGAPRAINGKIMIGNGGAEYGVRGYVSAYDATSGALVWRFYTVPGDPATPPESPAMAAAAETWTGDVYYQVGGGGTVWDSMAYDPELNFLYIGVGNGSPWNRWVRSPGGGDNLYLSSIVALDADTGAYQWHYQTTPADSWDFTATQHMILAELKIRGKPRRVIMQAPKNGFFYLLDRITGELLAADKYVPVTWASHVDLESGRPIETALADHQAQPQESAPSVLGGHNWQPMAFNSASGLVFIPAFESTQLFDTAEKFTYTSGNHWNLGQSSNSGKGSNALPDLPAAMLAASVKHIMRGQLIAWDPLTAERRWTVTHPTPWNGGVLSTRAGLVFQGNGARRLVAYAAVDGQRLWEVETGTGVVAPPISYAVDGEQYIAVLAGWGGVGGLALPQFQHSIGTSRLLVYKLGGTASHPVRLAVNKLLEQPPPVTGTGNDIEHGQQLYAEHCARCHGMLLGYGGVVKDLRYSQAATHTIFNKIVLDGVYAPMGMVGFSDVLSEKDASDIQQYILSRAHVTWREQQASGWWQDLKNTIYAQLGDWIGMLMAP